MYSLLPRINSGDGNIVDPVEFRLRPLESRDFPVILDADSQYFKWFIRFEVANEYMGGTLTGGIVRVRSNLIGGIGTLFKTELSPGDVIMIDPGGAPIIFATVAEIILDTVLKTVEDLSAFGSEEEPASYYIMRSRNIPFVPWPGVDAHNYTLAGTLSYLATASPINITGTGTLFLTELVVGDKIRLMDNDGVEQFLIIASIADDVTAVAFGLAGAAATNVAAAKFYTDYTDIEFSIFASGGGGQRFLGKSRVLGNQGVNGGGSPEIIPGSGAVSAIRRPYLYGKSGAVTVRVTNLVNDARRVHGHLFGARVRI